MNEEQEDPSPSSWISTWEQQCLDDCENELTAESLLHNETEASNQKMWYRFQNTATALATMYKGKFNGKRTKEKSQLSGSNPSAILAVPLVKLSSLGLL